MNRFTLSSVVLALLLPFLGKSETRTTLPSTVVDFLDINCYECHNNTDKKGSLDLESLEFHPDDSQSMVIWSMVHDRVSNREMPPKEEYWPEEEERGDFLNLFENTIHEESSKLQSSLGRVRSRRLNRIEYENTLHDLLGVDIPIKDFLPDDPSQDGFSNIAVSQQISHHLLQKYLEAIDISLDEAFSRAENQSKPYARAFSGEEVSWNPQTRDNGRGPHLYEGHAISFLTSGNYQGRMPPTEVDESGWYRITVRAKAHNPPPGRGVWTQIRSGVAAASAPSLFWVGSFEAREKTQDFILEAWIQAGHKLEMRPGDHTLGTISVKLLDDRSVFEKDVPGVAMESIKMERIYKGMSQNELKRRLYSDVPIKDGVLKSNNPKQDLEKLMTRFAIFAFRRSVSKTEMSPYMEFAHSRLDAGNSLKDALRSGYRALLSSPRFLYFTENTGKLDNFSIASRLSYFLWNTMPDEKLLTLAKKGNLSKPSILKKQVERMLNHPKAESFAVNFSNNWLNLKDIDFTTPDTKLYPEFDDILKHSMLGETFTFMQELIDNDMSVSNFIDSDFAMLNERLAEHYGIEGFSGTGYQKTALNANDHRGGVITHGSVLKVSANGTTTSPVIRGVWLLERILGEHISPPPDNAGSVEPDIRGAISIRDQLDKHRSTKSCMVCHKKIDPPGFALESFDVTGGWRQHYRALPKKGKWKDGPAVDPSYDLPNGKSFSDVEGFKAMVLEHPDKIAKNVVEKVLTYATGASIEFADRREIKQIVKDLEDHEYGFRSLIHACVQSDIFLSK
tara:strand:+ start:2103 stop:4472 length:2370 start_codon:yes stop_codon:yes gene_type:complete